MHIALATCHELPDWEVDDTPFHRALQARGAPLSHPPWNDREVSWADFDAVLIRTTWDYWHHHQEFVAWAAAVERCTKLFNPAKVVRWNTDKHYLQQLHDAGIPIAPTHWLTQGTSPDLRSLLKQRGWAAGFIKPVVGASASDTCRFTWDSIDVAQAHLSALLQRQDAMLQPYLAQVETLGELSAVVIDGTISHGVRKVPVPGDYRVQDDYGASDEPHVLTPQACALAERACQAAMTLLGMHAPPLYARVDFLCGDDDTLLLNELELVEPSLFFRHAPHAAGRLADALLHRITALS